MIYLRRFFALFLCLALSLTAFSGNVKASENNVPLYHVYFTSSVKPTSDSPTSSQVLGSLYPWKNENTSITKLHSLGSITYVDEVIEHYFNMTFAADNADEPLYNDIGLYRISISNIRASVFVGANAYMDASSVNAVIQYTDGSFDFGYVEDVTYDWPLDIQIEIDIAKPIRSIQLMIVYDLDHDLVNGEQMQFLAQTKDDQDFRLSFEELDKNTSLLSGILDKLGTGFKELTDGISDMFQAITDGFKNIGAKMQETINKISNGFEAVWNAINDLPAKLWKLIEDGLKSLFVPSDEYLSDYYYQFSDLLAENFGAIYEVIALLDNYFDFWEDGKTDYLDIPTVCIPVGDGECFTFGPYSVRIIPEGFDDFLLYVRFATSGLCFILYVNVMRKRIWEIIGGVSSS